MFYDQVEVEDFDFDPADQIFRYPCPCGDRFEISLAEMLQNNEDTATCPSCSLRIRVIYDGRSLLGYLSGQPGQARAAE